VKQWYQELFSNYAEKYEAEIFTQGTLGEVDFIEKEINYDKNCKILDVGCGTGRHAIELTKRGYEVTGVDLSENMLGKARKNASNFQILESAARSLNKKGKLIFTTLNGLFPLFHSVKDFINSNSTSQNKSEENTFDLMTFRDIHQMEIEGDDGTKMNLNCNERYYVPSEITWLLKSIDFNKIDIYGCKLGEFSRNDPLSTEDYEMLVIAEYLEK